MSAPDDVIAATGRAVDELTVATSRDFAELLRRMRNGQPWNSPSMVLVRARYAARRRDLAIARELLAALSPGGSR